MMTSRDKILNAVKNNQPDKIPLPQLTHFKGDANDILQKFMNLLATTGGKAILVKSFEDIAGVITAEFTGIKRIVTTIPELSGVAHMTNSGEEVHHLADVDLAIIKGHFGVAENAAVWVTEDLMQERALPFIAQSLAVVIGEHDIVPTMHEAYDRISNASYGFATFIAGPSKTADIEQSLVLGAHGPKSMTVFILQPAHGDNL